MGMKEMAEAGKTSHKVTLREPMTIEELHQLLVERWNPQTPASFKLKKGLFGSSIKFDVFMRILPVVRVKGNVVTIRRTETSTSVGGIDFKTLAQQVSAVKDGGLTKAFTGGLDYFIAITTAVKEILQDKV